MVVVFPVDLVFSYAYSHAIDKRETVAVNRNTSSTGKTRIIAIRLQVF